MAPSDRARPLSRLAATALAFPALLLATATASAQDAPAGAKLAQQYACTACHGVDKAIVGPSFLDVSKKYGDDKAALEKLVAKVRAGGSGAWGAIPMPPQGHLPDADVKVIVEWVLAGALTK